MRQRLADLARFAQAPAALGLGAVPSSPATATAVAPAGAQGGLPAQLLVGNPLDGRPLWLRLRPQHLRPASTP